VLSRSTERKEHTMRATPQLILAGTIAILLLAPAPARADGFVIPWVGSVFGNGLHEGRTSVGVSLGAMGGGFMGGELDLGYNPSFFGNESQFGNNSVVNAMANLIVGVPVGGQHGAGVRPYIVGGVGVIHSQIRGTATQGSSSDNMFGWDAGAGVMGYFSDHVGLRGDMRYIRGTHDLQSGINAIDLSGNHLHYWRASIGLVIR
jgi:opacity protein-like surface antigen